MTPRRSVRVVVVAVLISAGALASGIVLFSLNRATGQAGNVFSYADLVQETLASIAFLLTGAVVAVRRPVNAIGWLCLTLGSLSVIGWSATQYAANDSGPGCASLRSPRSTPSSRRRPRAPSRRPRCPVTRTTRR